jgi:hypothetical protein
VSADVIAYLETGEYVRTGWQQGVPYSLIELRGDFESEVFDSFDQQHRIACSGSDDFLCTGDGFRWKPSSIPPLRFT